MSMMGLAARPGTDVEPTCSTWSAAPPRMARIRAASRVNRPGQPGSYAASMIGPLCGTSFPIRVCCSSSSLARCGSGSCAAGGMVVLLIGLRAGFGFVLSQAAGCGETEDSQACLGKRAPGARTGGLAMTRMPGRYVLMLVSALLAAVSVPLAGVQAATTSASAGHATAEAATSHGNAAVWSMPSWLAIPSGRPAGARAPAGFAFLDGVFCTSAASCWAVGEQGNGQGVVNQALRWNGKTWRKVAVPNPGGTATDDVSELYAVRCQAARDCWAV